MADDRTRAIETALSQLEKQFGKGSVMRLGAKEAIGPISARRRKPTSQSPDVVRIPRAKQTLVSAVSVVGHPVPSLVALSRNLLPAGWSLHRFSRLHRPIGRHRRNLRFFRPGQTKFLAKLTIDPGVDIRMILQE